MAGKFPIRLNRRVGIAIVVAILIIVVTVVVYLLTRSSGNKRAQKLPPLLSSSQVESSASQSQSVALKAKDYEGYQITQRTLARQYLDNGDTQNALRLMSDVEKNVPSDKIDPESYEFIAGVYSVKKDTQSYKAYVQKIIDSLQNHGRSPELLVWQKELSK